MRLQLVDGYGSCNQMVDNSLSRFVCVGSRVIPHLLWFAYEGFRFVQRSLGGRDLDAVDKKKHPFKGIAVRLRLFPMNFNVIGMVFYILRSYVILRIGR
jgi:hypothetical protein